MKPVLELSNVTKTYRGCGVPAVDSVSLEVAEEEILTLLGPSGCGKSTLLRLIAGLERPDRGSIRIGGRTVAGEAWVEPEKRGGIGMVFQDYALFPHLTVAKNVAFPLHRLPKKSRAVRVAEALEVTGLDAFGKRYPHELSGGQQQRVALARALAGQPELILLDEPLSNLDADLRKQMRAEVKEILKKAGATAILVTHDQEDCFALASRVAVLKDGKIEQLGAPEYVYHEPESRFVANFLGVADYLPGIAGSGVIETFLGAFTDGELQSGAEVDLLIRPDDVALAENPGGSGVITERQFKGAEVLYTVETSGFVLHSLGPSYRGMPVGQRVDLEVNLDHLVVFPRNADRRVPRQLRFREAGHGLDGVAAL